MKTVIALALACLVTRVSTAEEAPTRRQSREDRPSLITTVDQRPALNLPLDTGRSTAEEPKSRVLDTNIVLTTTRNKRSDIFLEPAVNTNAGRKPGVVLSVGITW